MDNPNEIKMTVADLKKKLENIPDDFEVRYQRIEDVYFEEHRWNEDPITKKYVFDCIGNHKPNEPHNEYCYSEFISAFSVYTIKDEKVFLICAHYRGVDMNWIRVLDEKPVKPKGKYGVTCIVAEFDPCYDEINPGAGYNVTPMIYKEEDYIRPEGFYTFMDNGELVPSFGIVTHWMYLPKSPKYDPEVLNPIFKWFHEHSRPQTELKQI